MCGRASGIAATVRLTLAPLIFIQRITGDLAAQLDQLWRSVELEEAADAFGYVDQDVRRVACDLVLRQ